MLSILCSCFLLSLSRVLGGGVPLGCLLLIEEDPFSPLHLILLRYFLAQGVAHRHRTLLCCPLPSPEAFLATLAPLRAQPAAHRGHAEGELRIAWQYGRAGAQQEVSPGRFPLGRSTAPIHVRIGTKTYYQLPFHQCVKHVQAEYMQAREVSYAPVCFLFLFSFFWCMCRECILLGVRPSLPPPHL